jgi:hypothetical protein
MKFTYDPRYNVAYNLRELGRELRKAKERLRHKTEALRACRRRTGLSTV